MVLPAKNGTAALTAGPLAGNGPTIGSNPPRTEPVLWLRVEEPYAAELVLEDLRACARRIDTTERVLARFAVTRFVLLCLAGQLEEPLRRVERGIARRHLGRLPVIDPERRALARMLRACSAPPRSLRLLHSALVAARLADNAGHACGAHRLRHMAYMVGLSAGWPALAARSARSIAGHAARSGATAAARVWLDRAERLASE